MRAAVVEGPGRLVVRELPEPEPGPYEARCELLYGSVCTGTDQHVIEGTFPFPVSYPAVLGHESIGRVIDVGVNQVVPPDIDPAAATMMITWRETLSQLTRMGAGPGARVLVLGSGGNGIAFAAHAANLGAAEVVVVGSPAREAAARRAGATGFVDYHDDLATGLGPFDLLIDAVGRRGQLDRGLPHLRPGGTAAIYGLDEWGAITIDPARALGSFTVYNDGYDEPETHDAVAGFMRDGRLDARLWLDLDSPFPLDDIGAAIQSLRERQTLKALVRLSD